MTTLIRRITLAGAALALVAGSARADVSAAAFADEFGALAMDATAAAPSVAAEVAVIAPPVVGGLAWVPRERPETHASVRYVPRTRRARHATPLAPTGFFHLYGGAFDPEGRPEARFLGGMRAGAMPDPHLRVGALLEWSHRQNDHGTLVSSVPGPGGVIIDSEVDVQRSTFDLVPFMAFAEYHAVPESPVSPYFGLAGGGEWLHLTADDISIPVGFEADYAGWGWQSWAGVSVELGPAARFTGEVFLNQATVSRDAYDPILGFDVRESVNVDGGGVRAGLTWEF